MRKSAVDHVPETSRDLEHHSRELGLIDELTGLLNGDALRFLGSYQVRLARRTGRPFALLYVEVARPERSSAGGHGVEDEALREAAELLLTTFRASDVCARLAGSEFGVLLSEVSRARIGPQIARLRLLELLERTMASGATRPGIAFRTGVASFEPESSESFDRLLARAQSDAKALSVTAAEKRANELAASSADVRLLAAR
jgi:diguanylate cyclase (GGDEF)-like protein